MNNFVLNFNSTILLKNIEKRRLKVRAKLVEMFNLLTKVENHGFREDFKIIVKRIIFLLRVYKTFLSEKLCFPDNVSQLIVSFLFLNFTKNTSNA